MNIYIVLTNIPTNWLKCLEMFKILNRRCYHKVWKSLINLLLIRGPNAHHIQYTIISRDAVPSLELKIVMKVMELPNKFQNIQFNEQWTKPIFLQNNIRSLISVFSVVYKSIQISGSLLCFISPPKMQRINILNLCSKQTKQTWPTVS